ncbi:MAG: 2TM domain-containing protein [Bacteroidota bacterium]
MDKDIYKKTRVLLKQLNYFILHVIIYFLGNVGLVIMAFSDIGEKWWIFLFLAIWAVGIIYHAFRVYGVDFLSRKNKKVNAFFNYILKLAGS